MSDFDNIKFGKITKSQKKKADRIIELMRRLESEGISMFAVSTPTNYLAFVRCDTDRAIDGLNFNDIPEESVYCTLNTKGLVSGVAL